MTNIIPETVLDALNAFNRNQKADIPYKKIANLRTALKKYILPDLPRYNFSAMALTGKGFEACLAQVSLRVFLDAKPLEILAFSCQKAQEAGELKPSIERTTYRPALNLFVTWVEEQQWFIPKDQARIPKYIPRSHFGQNLQKTNKGNRCYHKEAYGLKESELTSKLQSQLKKLQNFCTGEYVPERQDKKMRQHTFTNHRKRILLFLGWLKNIQLYSLEELELEKIIDMNVLNGFIAWGINERKNTQGWASGFCDAALNVAKWIYASSSKRPMYRDIPVIEEIRMINKKLNQAYALEKKSLKRDKKVDKEMTMQQCIEVVSHLRKRCAPRDSYGGKRSDISIARAWLRYLLVAIFTYCPVRQREVREWEIGRTFHITDKGYQIKLQPEDNKTGDERVFMLSDVLPPEVLVDLDEWIQVWRPKFKQVTQNLDDWLAFIHRREYKNVAELNQYIERLQVQIEEATRTGAIEVRKELEQSLAAAQRDFGVQPQVKDSFQNRLVFISFGTNDNSRFGRPFDASDIGSIVRRAVYSATSDLIREKHPLFEGVNPKKTNPHFFRNIAITHERRYGDPFKRKDFHKMLGNSEAVGDRDYNEMHPEEKTCQIKNWWDPDKDKGKQGSFLQIQKLIPNLTLEERFQLLQLLNNY